MAAKGISVRLIKVDLPEPDTPVIQVKVPIGIVKSTSCKLLPVAPFSSICIGTIFFALGLAFFAALAAAAAFALPIGIMRALSGGLFKSMVLAL